MDDREVEQLVGAASIAAVEAGKVILKIYALQFDVTNKDDGSPVTQADLESSLIIKETLKPTNLPFVCEEDCIYSYDERSSFPLYWLVDPLDGTKEFVKHNDEFTVNIALMESQKPIAGIVYSPILDILWIGFCMKSWRMEKATTKNLTNFDEIVKTATPLPLPYQKRPYTILVSRSHRDSQVDDYINKSLLPFHPNAVIKPLGSTLKFAMLAEGKADINVCFSPTKEWDTAAAQALLEATGGHVCRIVDNKGLEYGKEDFRNPPFIATNFPQT